MLSTNALKRLTKRELGSARLFRERSLDPIECDIRIIWGMFKTIAAHAATLAKANTTQNDKQKDTAQPIFHNHYDKLHNHCSHNRLTRPPPEPVICNLFIQIWPQYAMYFYTSYFKLKTEFKLAIYQTEGQHPNKLQTLNDRLQQVDNPIHVLNIQSLPQQAVLNFFKLTLENVAGLTSLSLNEYKFNHEEVAIIANAIQTNMTITTLELTNIQFCDRNSRLTITEALSLNTTIRSLYITKSNIDMEHGISLLAKMIRQNNILTTINLSKNNITDTEASAIGDALKTNPTLTTINLSTNNITDQGASALAAALEKSSIQTLNLGANNIGKAGASALAAALEKSSVTTFKYGGYLIDETELTALAKAVIAREKSLAPLTILGICNFESHVTRAKQMMSDETRTSPSFTGLSLTNSL